MTTPSVPSPPPQPVVGQPTTPVDFFRRMPGGGTQFIRPAAGNESDVLAEFYFRCACGCDREGYTLDVVEHLTAEHATNTASLVQQISDLRGVITRQAGELAERDAENTQLRAELAELRNGLVVEYAGFRHPAWPDPVHFQYGDDHAANAARWYAENVDKHPQIQVRRRVRSGWVTVAPAPLVDPAPSAPAQEGQTT